MVLGGEGEVGGGAGRRCRRRWWWREICLSDRYGAARGVDDAAAALACLALCKCYNVIIYNLL